jgi:hypothetical protein
MQYLSIMIYSKDPLGMDRRELPFEVPHSVHFSWAKKLTIGDAWFPFCPKSYCKSNPAFLVTGGTMSPVTGSVPDSTSDMKWICPRLRSAPVRRQSRVMQKRDANPGILRARIAFPAGQGSEFHAKKGYFHARFSYGSWIGHFQAERSVLTGEKCTLILVIGRQNSLQIDLLDFHPDFLPWNAVVMRIFAGWFLAISWTSCIGRKKRRSCARMLLIHGSPLRRENGHFPLNSLDPDKVQNQVDGLIGNWYFDSATG